LTGAIIVVTPMSWSICSPAIAGSGSTFALVLNGVRVKQLMWKWRRATLLTRKKWLKQASPINWQTEHGSALD